MLLNVSQYFRKMANDEQLVDQIIWVPRILCDCEQNFNCKSPY